MTFLSRPFHRVAARSRAAVATALRTIGDTAHAAADRVSPVARPKRGPAPRPIVPVFHMLAAFAPLPQPPTATGDADIDADNLITYQRALAEHAKRTEQLRTLGTLVASFAR